MGIIMLHTKLIDYITDITGGIGLLLAMYLKDLTDLIHLLAGIGGLIVLFISIKIKVVIYRSKKLEYDKNLKNHGRAGNNENGTDRNNSDHPDRDSDV